MLNRILFVVVALLLPSIAAAQLSPNGCIAGRQPARQGVGKRHHGGTTGHPSGPPPGGQIWALGGPPSRTVPKVCRQPVKCCPA